MHFTIFHIITLIILLCCFALVCLLIFLKIKQKETALIFYTIATVFTALLIYSIFLTINQFTTQAHLSKLSYTRDLRHESVIISGKVQNLTQFSIKKCYLILSIVDQRQVGGEIFNDKNIRNAKMQNTSVSYTIEIIDKLPGNTYKEFKANVPFPPSFNNAEFYHTLKCI
ncbi:DUF2393 domain-containing protein [Campylobacter hepaticus]|uniref:DUF2393 domain-containing protein n=1 Tax=Campylobacter hepaticus TaxID=1813019 RepID=A0A424Z3A9_9BACT|nr:DUF2393 family protein [Campylobacter hepaticus]AXP09380.1 DUF2393 domain-containing protein [Campylobacter hepaticus]MCZ0772878.1 DUF2393 domain-containing protein [Campylobacter hepaticus]MCZ0774347.1 DUF2393 domain-containing protein [Campylobacter hepaticus]MCZ0775599.1 DUF2393 domain-containing protein [Campylobacter hepaticus]MDX2330966.1 DUF2393 family protein [Campylobacter hepaticus]